MRSATLSGVFGAGVLLSMPGLFALTVIVAEPLEARASWLLLAGSTLLATGPLVWTWRRMDGVLRNWAVLLATLEYGAILVGVPNLLSFVQCR